MFAARGPPRSAHLRALSFPRWRTAFPFLNCSNFFLILFAFRQVQRRQPREGGAGAARVCAPVAPPDRQSCPPAKVGRPLRGESLFAALPRLCSPRPPAAERVSPSPRRLELSGAGRPAVPRAAVPRAAAPPTPRGVQRNAPQPPPPARRLSWEPRERRDPNSNLLSHLLSVLFFLNLRSFESGKASQLRSAFRGMKVAVSSRAPSPDAEEI